MYGVVTLRHAPAPAVEAMGFSVLAKGWINALHSSSNGYTLDEEMDTHGAA